MICALVRPTRSTVETRPLNMVTPSMPPESAGDRNTRSRWNHAPSNAPSRIAVSQGAPLIVAPGHAAIVSCCRSTSSPSETLSFKPWMSTELARNVLPRQTMFWSQSVKHSTAPLAIVIV